MVKTLYSKGVIEKLDYEILEQAARLKNLAVHGLKIPPIDGGLMQQWRLIVVNLLYRVERYPTSNRT